MSEVAAKTGLDDYLVAGGTVQELLLMAQPFEPVELTRERLKRDEGLQAAVENLWGVWRSMRTVTRGECSTRSAVRALIEEVPRSGKVLEEGVRVEMSYRTLAERSGFGLDAAKRAIDHAEDAGILRRDNEGRKRDRAGAFVLFADVALPEQYGGRDTGGRESQEGGEKVSPLFTAPCDPGVRVAQRPAEVPELRWPTVLTMRELDKRGRWQKVYEYLARLGKKRGEMVRYLLEAGGSVTVAELMQHFAGERTRPYDFKRRQLAELAGWRYDRKVRKWLTTGPPLIAVEGETVTLLDGWREALEKHREQGREEEAARLQAQKHARQRQAFRKRGETPADEVPPMHPIDDMRQPWPLHPEGCACRECVERLGRDPGPEHVEDCRCAACFTVRKEEAGTDARGRRRVIPLESRQRNPREHRSGREAPAVVVPMRPDNPATVAGLSTRPTWTLHPISEEHPLDCECHDCTTRAPSYAKLGGTA